LESKLNNLEKLIEKELEKSKEEIQLKKMKDEEVKRNKEIKEEINKLKDEKLKKRQRRK